MSELVKTTLEGEQKGTPEKVKPHWSNCSLEIRNMI